MRIIDSETDARHFAGTDGVVLKACRGSRYLHLPAATDAHCALKAA
ncbi:hypothetical protein FY152_15115 [Agrobacterium tumefaciens]|nr:hypothetical protein FY152_15115 [Agrobacterium tumefaciens]